MVPSLPPAIESTVASTPNGLIFHGYVRSLLRCIIHSVLFNRALGSFYPRDMDAHLSLSPTVNSTILALTRPQILSSSFQQMVPQSSNPNPSSLSMNINHVLSSLSSSEYDELQKEEFEVYSYVSF
jgi:hypothetical protein